MIPYVLPGTCFGIGYILAFHHQPLKLTQTAYIIILNILFRQLPVIIQSASSSLAQMSEKVEMAARDLGATKIEVLRDVVWPSLKSTYITGFVYNFTGAMTTSGAVLFLITPRYKMAVYTLYDAINAGEYGVACLMSAMIILVSVFMFCYPDIAKVIGMPQSLHSQVIFICLMVISLFGLGLYIAIWVYMQNRFFLTNESVIQEIQISLFSKREQTVSLMNIEDSSYSQKGILQTLFNYGSIRLSTEGDETTYRFSYVADPKNQVAVLNNAVEAFKNGRPVTNDD